MREGLTEVVMLLDRSGSMSGLENDTICSTTGQRCSMTGSTSARRAR